MRTLHVVGFDPGGDQAFGWAALSWDEGQVARFVSGTCSNAPDALHAARVSIPCEPAAFAVDAPLFWIPSADRKADQLIRKMVCAAGGSSGTVSHVNSLRGACLVQGVLVARMAAQAWPEAIISEAHPKALLQVSSAARAFANAVLKHSSTEHERDAGLAAFTALNLMTDSTGWHDLVKLEQDHYFPAGNPVAFWFPQYIA
jgi:hypothetical protein